MEPIIKVENLSKQYRLGIIGTGTLAHDLTRWWYRIRGKEDPYLMVGESNDRTIVGDSDYVWALKDINFEVKQGEILGIIGKNGAGKSTLLKLLSRVTAPSTGKITCHGRIASLLEVGTGFHPELTGRENIYLNGAILGMTKKEIASKFDEIVDFAGCQKYIETPVKRYSSGMYVRLAFAVAAHLEPDILVVDEVLAVGDAEFQKKAIGKMQDVSKNNGRTVLFVSHNMSAVKSLCTRGVVLQNGRGVFEGTAEEAVSFYLKDGNNEIINERIFEDKLIDNAVKVKNISIKNKSRTIHEPIVEDDVIELVTEIDVHVDPDKYHVTYHLLNEFGDAMFSMTHTQKNIKLKLGFNKLVCVFPKKFLQAGNFSLKFLIVKNKKKVIYKEDSIITFTVVNGGAEIGSYMGREPGFIIPNFEWVLEDKI